MNVVWECSSCATRSFERRCEECNLFCSKVGPGGECPNCSKLVGTAELEGGDTPAGRLVIGVEFSDAVELAEVLDYVVEWVTIAPPAVTASLAEHGGGPEALPVLLEALIRHSQALTTTVPVLS